MKINFEKNVVEFCPESPNEKAKMEMLWRIVLDCGGVNNKKLSPIGEYVPSKSDKGASFLIEGLEGAADANAYQGIRVEFDCKVYCMECNNLIDLKKGDPIPICCGRMMEIVD